MGSSQSKSTSLGSGEGKKPSSSHHSTEDKSSTSSSCCVFRPFQALRIQYREKRAEKRQLESFGHHPWMSKEMYEIPTTLSPSTTVVAAPPTVSSSGTVVGSVSYSKKAFLELRTIDLDAIKRVKLTPTQYRQEEERFRRSSFSGSCGTPRGGAGNHSRTSSLGDEGSVYSNNNSRPNTPVGCGSSTAASTPTPSTHSLSRQGSFSRIDSYRLEVEDCGGPTNLYRFHCCICQITLFDDEAVKVHIAKDRRHCARRSLVQERRSLGYVPEYNFLLRQKFPFELSHQVLAFLLSKPPVPFFKQLSDVRPCGHGWCTLPRNVNCCACLDKRRYELGHNNASALPARKAAGATKKRTIKYCAACVENEKRWEKAMRSRKVAAKRKQDEGAAKVIERLKDHFEDLEGFRW